MMVEQVRVVLSDCLHGSWLCVWCWMWCCVCDIVSKAMCDVVCDCVDGSMGGGEGSGKVKWLILRQFNLTNWQGDLDLENVLDRNKCFFKFSFIIKPTSAKYKTPKNNDFKLFWGFVDWQNNEQTLLLVKLGWIVHTQVFQLQ